jgi:hypothetical protein
LREPVAVTEAGTDLDRTWAQQAADALLALNEAAEAARAADQDAVDAETRTKHEDWYRRAAETGIALNAARKGKPATAPAHSTPSPAHSRAAPGSPKPDKPARHQSAGQPEPESRPTYLVTSRVARAKFRTG